MLTIIVGLVASPGGARAQSFEVLIVRTETTPIALSAICSIDIRDTVELKQSVTLAWP